MELAEFVKEEVADVAGKADGAAAVTTLLSVLLLIESVGVAVSLVLFSIVANESDFEENRLKDGGMGLRDGGEKELEGKHRESNQMEWNGMEWRTKE